jgi:acrylyl-CoA reductase (NADPH)
MVPGIDLAGRVLESADLRWETGQPVIVTGCGLGETHWGGYAERVRVDGDWLVPLPAGFSPRDAMAIGTAGFTAMLCRMALEEHEVLPGSGPVLVTGAAGGVGSVAVALLAAAGYQVVASTGREETHDYLRELGAAEIVDREELASLGSRPLSSERWAGAVDVVGGATLAAALASTRAGGSVAACGLAGSSDLATTVFPFILRGVNLLGINSVYVAEERRRRAWDRLARELPPQRLETMVGEVELAEVPEVSRELLAGRVRGRVVVRIDA